MKIKQSNGTWEDFPLPISIGDFNGASSSTKGASGTVPAPAAGDQAKFLRGDGQWATPNIGNISVDTAISSTSTNPVQNKAVKAEIDKLNTGKATQQNWTASIKCATWSRLCYIAATTSVVGSSFILNIAATRNNVVYNETFAINVNHSQKATIAKLGTANYSPVQLRVVSGSSGNCYVEIYDTANSATNTTTQSVTCRLFAFKTGTLTAYTTFTDGSTIPDGYKNTASITTNGNSLQGNLTWGEITGKPNYAGSGSAGGSANSAVKLDTATAGSATQPVYFSGGKPVATTYTLSKSVPSDAKFTDTWRGIQNVLTSDSTTDSLSAAQGKVLKGLVDGKAASNHTHNNLSTSGDTRSTATTPNTYQNVLKFQGLKTNTTINSPSSDTYSYLLGLRGWSDSSGGMAHELAFNNAGIFTRKGESTAWNSWQKIITSGDKATTSAFGIVKTGSNITNTDGVISLTKANITTALGYTPSSANTTYGSMTGATVSAAGVAGLVPAPAAGKQTSFLRGDGTWVVPTNTTYNNFTGSSAAQGGLAGLVPAPPKAGANLFLASSGSWASLPVNGIAASNPNLTLTNGLLSLTKANVVAALGYTPPTSDTNTDTKVTNTLATTTKAYVTGTTSATTNTGTQVFDTNVYLDTTAGTLVAKTFKTSTGIEIY